MTYLADVFMWCWCWVAYRLYAALPYAPNATLLGRFTYWLLPYAGYYGYHEPWMNWRWSKRPAERPAPDEGCPF